ncbi:MAG: hypothetical protein RBS55_11080 [Bacteroidales bacterium]|nr:hypothetical protein [Bacteroidales bacterium]
MFFVIILIYFYPTVEGKKMETSDLIHFKGMAKEITSYLLIMVGALVAGLMITVNSTKMPMHLKEEEVLNKLYTALEHCPAKNPA